MSHLLILLQFVCPSFSLLTSDDITVWCRLRTFHPLINVLFFYLLKFLPGPMLCSRHSGPFLFDCVECKWRKADSPTSCKEEGVRGKHVLNLPHCAHRSNSKPQFSWIHAQLDSQWMESFQDEDVVGLTARNVGKQTNIFWKISYQSQARPAVSSFQRPKRCVELSDVKVRVSFCGNSGDNWNMEEHLGKH